MIFFYSIALLSIIVGLCYYEYLMLTSKKNRLQKEEIVKAKGKAPSVLCVICGLSNAAYQRPDGVYVVPITALKP